MSRSRPSILLWHRWFGLIAGLWLFLMGATGAILVFYAEIDRALNPDLFTASAGPAQPVDRWVAAAQARHPDRAVRFIDLPNTAGKSATLWLEKRADLPPDPRESNWQVFVDPATAEVLGDRDYSAIDLSRRGITNFLYTFHHTLHLGETVAWLLGLVALLWLIDHVASVVLAFPTAARWRQSFRIRPGVHGHKRVFDLHRAIGLWLFPVTLTLAVSGVYFNWRDEFRAAVNAVSPLTPRADQAAPALPTPLTAPPIGWDAALARADAPVDGIAYNAAKGLYWLRLFDARDIDPSGRRWLFVDARNGAILSDRHATQGSAGDMVMAWQFPLHSGKAFGWPGRIAIFMAGIATCLFVVTGFMMWARKRRARLTVDKRQPALAPAE
jgi:uncharacterized iron-regulated membrane protein